MITVMMHRMPSMPRVCLVGESISSSVCGIGSRGRLAFFFFVRSLGAAFAGGGASTEESPAGLSGSDSLAIGALGYRECRSHATDPGPWPTSVDEADCRPCLRPVDLGSRLRGFSPFTSEGRG